jgi:hypothetical protein
LIFAEKVSEHLDYGAWQSHGLEVMTNNQGNCFAGLRFTLARAFFEMRWAPSAN